MHVMIEISYYIFEYLISSRVNQVNKEHKSILNRASFHWQWDAIIYLTIIFRDVQLYNKLFVLFMIYHVPL